MARPTILRLQRSMTAAKYNQPSPVGMLSELPRQPVKFNGKRHVPRRRRYAENSSKTTKVQPRVLWPRRRGRILVRPNWQNALDGKRDTAGSQTDYDG
jgi:hypothetical protein